MIARQLHRRLTILALAVATLLTAAPAPAETADLTNRVVRILTTFQVQNPFIPWLSQAPGNRSGYGILIGHGHVLTTEHLVRNATQVELRHPRSGERLATTVEATDPRLNLALLSIRHRGSTPDIEPLTTAGPATVGSPLQVLQFDSGENIQSVEGTVSQIAVSQLPDGPYAILSYELLCELNIDGEGAPVIHDNKLAGLVMNHQATTRIATFIGQPFLDRFLSDASSPPYRGSASAGFSWRQLVDPAKRNFLGLDGIPGGIQVIASIPGTAAHGILQPMDVVLSWGGHPLDNLGYYIDDVFGRQEFSHLVKGKASPGDRVDVEVWRSGKRQTVALPLGGDPDAAVLVPENVTGERAEYLVAGGLVLRELDMFMLRAFGNDWRAKADPKLLHHYLAGTGTKYRPGDRVVVLNGILPDEINVGYQAFRTRIVTAVNGSPVRNLREVFAVSDRDGAIHRVTLDGIGIDVVLDRESLPQANRRIQEHYRIPTLEYRRPVAPPESTTP
jgi:S1-C subfamily serine protease